MTVVNEEQGRHSLINLLVTMQNLEPEQLANLLSEVDTCIEECIDTKAYETWYLPLIEGDNGEVSLEPALKTDDWKRVVGITNCVGAIRIESELEPMEDDSGGLYEPLYICVSAIDLSSKQIALFEEVCRDLYADLKAIFLLRTSGKSLLELINRALNRVQ